MTGEHGAEGLTHVEGGEQAAVLGGKQQEIPRQSLDLELLQHRGERSSLRLGGEDRALDEAREVLRSVEGRVEAGKISGNLIERLPFEGQLEQRLGVTAGYAGTGI